MIRKLDAISETIIRSLTIEPNKDKVVAEINGFLKSLDEVKINRAFAWIVADEAKIHGLSDDQIAIIRWVEGRTVVNVSLIINVNFSTVAQLNKLMEYYIARR